MPQKTNSLGQLYLNGKILTMDDNHPEAEALYVENGKISCVGKKEDVFKAAGEQAEPIDLQGCTLMPAFIDSHSHFTGLANSLDQCDLSECTDLEEIILRLRRFIVENKIQSGEWVVGVNYDHNFLREKRHPTRDVLDKVSEQNPVMVVHASSHMGAVNSLGLQSQNLTDHTQDPEGGHYGRTPDGALNGYMEENAFVGFRNGMPMPSPEKLMDQMRRAQQIYARHGITTIQEGMTTEPLFQLLLLAQSQQVLYLDLCAYLDLESCAHLPEIHPELVKQYCNHLRIGGFKIFLDGSPQGRTAWMLDPYANDVHGYRGYPIKDDATLYQEILTALKARKQLLAHCNGDAAAEQFISAFERVHQEHPEYPLQRPVMIHAQLVHPQQLERMRSLGMMPSFFVAHTYYWGDIHIQNFGMDRAANISPAGSALRLNLPLTFHQDTPVLPPDVFRSIWCAARRITRSGVELNPAERVSVYDGLKAATVWAAWQYGEENEKGSLAQGKRADLILLDHNPLETPLDALPQIRVLKTIKDGQCIFSCE